MPKLRAAQVCSPPETPGEAEPPGRAKRRGEGTTAARPTADGRAQLYGNEGALTAITKDGMVYSLLFGEVTYESGIALTAGVAGDSSSEDDKGVMEPEEEDGEDTNKTASRFMFVDIAYDPSLDENLSINKDDGGADAGAEGAEGEGAEAEGAAATEAPSSEPDPEDETKRQEGMERAKKLRARFDQWFYVISDSSFKQIHKERSELFKDAPADAGTEDSAPG